MKKISRRTLLRTATATALGAGRLGTSFLIAAPRPTAIRVEEVRHTYEDFPYRAPYAFGGRSVDRVTILNVRCTVRTADGRVARGSGSMPLGNLWSFPSKTLSYDATLGAMKRLAERIEKITADDKEPGHPVEINSRLEPGYLKAAGEVSKELKLAEPIPKLCTLVTASPFDAAIHDAFGKVHQLNCYRTYGRDFMTRDLGSYLSPEFKGSYPDHYVLALPKSRLRVFHSVGAGDPIVESDIKKRINDGLPETLPDWISRDGINHFKIKLNGDDLNGDLERILRIEHAANEAERKRQVSYWVYSLDFNEQCPNADYLLDFMRRLNEKAPAAFRRIQYIEQPTARDLQAKPESKMHAAAKLKPVVIDESLTDFESLQLAREMGYTGVALKACKGQSQSVLMAAAAHGYRMFVCFQDLTCPGGALIQSAGLAAYIQGVAALEANAREYVPAANKPWESKFPGIFLIKNGTMNTSGLTRPGLSAVED